MEILKETIGGVPVGTLVVGMAIILGIVWLWSRWDERKARKRRAKRAEYQASIQEDTGVRARVMEEAKRVLHETRLSATSANDDLKKSGLDLSRMSSETLARDLYISTQMETRFPQLASGAYRAALEEEIWKRGYSIEAMLHAANAATTWEKDEARDMVHTALERQLPESPRPGR
jgi:hypothetical protein